MFTDSRLVNTAANFCLCSSCSKTDITKGIICATHEAFMRMTESLKVAAPVFACGEFVEKDDAYNFLDQYYDGPDLSTRKSMSGYYEYMDRIKRDWKAQKEIWKEAL